MRNNRRPVMQMGVVDVGIETARLPNGHKLDLAIIRHPGASAVVALDDRERVVMLNQFRYAVGGWLWELPAGCRKRGESARRCAERELREEAGLRASRWERLGAIVTIPSFCDERIELYLARGLSAAEKKADADEVIRVKRVPFSKALEMIGRGRIVDAKTIAALHRAQALVVAQARSRAR